LGLSTSVVDPHLEPTGRVGMDACGVDTALVGNPVDVVR
jgi:hypothetical protein